jgi:hypothetical protein
MGEMVEQLLVEEEVPEDLVVVDPLVSEEPI